MAFWVGLVGFKIIFGSIGSTCVLNNVGFGYNQWRSQEPSLGVAKYENLFRGSENLFQGSRNTKDSTKNIKLKKISTAG